MSATGEDPWGLAELAALQQEAEALAAVLSGGSDESARYSASDADGAVTVTVDGDGRVRDVTLAAGWRDLVGITGVEPAVIEAVGAAGWERMSGWAAAVADRAAAPQPIGDRAGGHVRTTARTDMPTQPHITDIVDLLAAALPAIDQMTDETFTPTDVEVVGRSPSHHVTVRMRAGHVVGMELDRHWLTAAPAYRVGPEIRAAFDALAPDLAAQQGRDMLPTGPLRDLLALTDDPGALLRAVGLPAPGTDDPTR